MNDVNKVTMIHSTPRARRRAHNRKRIQAVVLAQVAARGVDGITMASVAKAVDLTPAALYRYFPNKGAMMAAAVSDVLKRQRQVLERLRGLAGATASDPVLLVLAAVEQQIALAMDEPEAFALISILMAEPRQLVDDPMDAAHIPELVGVLTSLRGLLEQAADLGWLAEGDAQDRALTLVFALNGVLQLQKLRRFRPDIDPARLARAAGRDLLMGWGVNPADLDARSLAAVRLARRAMEEVT